MSYRQAADKGLLQDIQPWIHHFCIELQAKTEFSDTLRARAIEFSRFIAAWPDNDVLHLAKDAYRRKSAFSAMVANRLDRFLFENEWDGMLLHRSTMVHTDEPDFLVHYFGLRSTMRLVGQVEEAMGGAAAYAARANQSDMFECTEHPFIVSFTCDRIDASLDILISGRYENDPALWTCGMGLASWHSEREISLLLMKLYHAVHNLPEPLPAPLSAPVPFPNWIPEKVRLLSLVSGVEARSTVQYGQFCYKFLIGFSDVQVYRDAKEAVSQLHVMCIFPVPPSSHIFAVRLPYIRDVGNISAEPTHFLVLIDQLQQFHRHGMVHGDICRSNLLLASDPSKSLLIGFDCASPCGTHYSSNYTSSMPERHPIAKAGQEMRPEHDIHSLLYIVSGIREAKNELTDAKWDVVVQQLQQH